MSRRAALVLALVLALALAACDEGRERGQRPSPRPSTPSPSPSSGSPSPSGSSSPSVPGSAECTLVLGFSVTMNWFEGGGFEARPEISDDEWELIAEGGHDVWIWADPGIPAYARAPSSPCGREPDRVLFQVAARGWRSRSAEDVAAALRTSIENIRATWPSATTIELIPVVGGPGAQPCELASFGGRTVDASGMNPAMTAVISGVADGERVVAGPDLLLADCGQYLDGMGHLTPDGSRYIASVLAEHYGA